MEIWDYLMQFLLENVSIQDEDFDSIRFSIFDCVSKNQYEMLYDNNGKFLGFITWEIKKSDACKEKIDIGICNLVIEKQKRGEFNLHSIINLLRRRYHNINKFIWISRKKKVLRMFQANKRVNSCLNIS